jgi:hypothetical protein
MITRDRDNRPPSKAGHYTFKHKGQWYHIPYRDSQRERLYRAERVALAREYESMPIGNRGLLESEAYIRSVMASGIWLAICRGNDLVRNKVTLEPGRSCRASFHRITLNKWGRCKPVILHELAHVCTTGSGHHWPFAAAYLDLVANHMSQDAARRLRDAFSAEGVRFQPPRQMKLSDERREQLRQRGLALAAMRREAASA